MFAFLISTLRYNLGLIIKHKSVVSVDFLFHRNIMNSTTASDIESDEDYAPPPSSQVRGRSKNRWCSPCSLEILPKNWARHLKAGSHIRRLSQESRSRRIRNREPSRDSVDCSSTRTHSCGPPVSEHSLSPSVPVDIDAMRRCVAVVSAVDASTFHGFYAAARRCCPEIPDQVAQGIAAAAEIYVPVIRNIAREVRPPSIHDTAANLEASSLSFTSDRNNSTSTRAPTPPAAGLPLQTVSPNTHIDMNAFQPSDAPAVAATETTNQQTQGDASRRGTVLTDLSLNASFDFGDVAVFSGDEACLPFAPSVASDVQSLIRVVSVPDSCDAAKINVISSTDNTSPLSEMEMFNNTTLSSVKHRRSSQHDGDLPGTTTALIMTEGNASDIVVNTSTFSSLAETCVVASFPPPPERSSCFQLTAEPRVELTRIPMETSRAGEEKKRSSTLPRQSESKKKKLVIEEDSRRKNRQEKSGKSRKSSQCTGKSTNNKAESSVKEAAIWTKRKEFAEAAVAKAAALAASAEERRLSAMQPGADPDMNKTLDQRISEIHAVIEEPQSESPTPDSICMMTKPRSSSQAISVNSTRNDFSVPVTKSSVPALMNIDLPPPRQRLPPPPPPRQWVGHGETSAMNAAAVALLPSEDTVAMTPYLRYMLWATTTTPWRNVPVSVLPAAVPPLFCHETDGSSTTPSPHIPST